MIKRIGSATLILSSILALSACSSKEIKFTSDDGVTTTVNNESVTTLLFNIDDAVKAYDEWLVRLQKGLVECVRDFPNKQMCNDEYQKAITEKTAERDQISSMPKISIIQYESKSVNSQGKATSSTGQSVACLPAMDSTDQSTWENIIDSVYDLTDSNLKNLSYNIGNNKQSIDSLLCDKYSR